MKKYSKRKTLLLFFIFALVMQPMIKAYSTDYYKKMIQAVAPMVVFAAAAAWYFANIPKNG